MRLALTLMAMAVLPFLVLLGEQDPRPRHVPAPVVRMLHDAQTHCDSAWLDAKGRHVIAEGCKP